MIFEFLNKYQNWACFLRHPVDDMGDFVVIYLQGKQQHFQVLIKLLISAWFWTLLMFDAGSQSSVGFRQPFCSEMYQKNPIPTLVTSWGGEVWSLGEGLEMWALRGDMAHTQPPTVMLQCPTSDNQPKNNPNPLNITTFRSSWGANGFLLLSEESCEIICWLFYSVVHESIYRHFYNDHFVTFM